MEEAILAVVRHLGATCGVVFEVGGVRQSLVVVAAECPDGSVDMAHEGRPCPQAQYTFGAGGLVVVEDLRHETRFATADLLDRGVGSGVSAVIMVDAAPYGVLAAYATTPRCFLEDEAAFVQSTANILGMAIERQRHLEVGLSPARHERWAFVGQLAAGFAHDLDNILAAITLYAELLDRQQWLDIAGRSHLDAIRRQAECGASLVGQLRDSARDRPLLSGTVEMGSFVERFLPVLQHTLPVGVRLTAVHDMDPYLVTADNRRLQQILMNLVSSAGEAIAGPGEVRITLTRHRFDQRYLCIDIADAGGPTAPGGHGTSDFFPTAAIPGRDSTLDRPLNRLISDVGGHVELVTNPSHTTVFRLWLPTLHTPTVSPPPALPIPLAMGESVLVVDDDPAMRHAIASVLELLGYGAIAVGSGEDAISILETAASSIPLVLSDAVMPGMGGETLAQAVSDRWPGIAVILASGFPAPTPQEPTRRTGPGESALAPVWLQKPFTSHEMATAINAALRPT